MRRREVITLLGGAAAAWPFAADAQRLSGKVYQIGFLGVTSLAPYTHHVEALRAGLRKLGYEEGKNIVIHYRWAEARYHLLDELAAELVKLNVDVIITHSSSAAFAVKQATSTIPVVVASIGDPVELGLVSSLSHPGGNITGLSFFWAPIAAKRLELIKEAVPVLTRVAILANPAAPARQ